MNRGMFAQLNRPEYIYQPQKLIRRLLGKVHEAKGNGIVELPWNLSLEVDTSEAIGRILSHHGIFEIPVVEALFRLIDPGDLVLDAGANIGYMTAVAISAGAAKVISFEPHPFVYARLARNVERWNREPHLAGRVDARREAISKEKGSLPLFVPNTAFARNNGLATLEESKWHTYDKVQVATTTLDSVIAETGHFVGVIKIDIEGHELQALEGARGSLASKKIRDIIYESFGAVDSDASKLLAQFGYSIFVLQSTVCGPVLLDKPKGNKPKYGDHNLLATLDPGRVRNRMSARGFRCFVREAKAGLLSKTPA